MKETNGTLHYKGKDYALVFDLNVMEQIQDEYGTLDKWGQLTDGKDGEVNAKAVIFGFMCMINEGLEIENEENGTSIPLFTRKQVGRLITEVGLMNATSTLNETVVNSAGDESKNT